LAWFVIFVPDGSVLLVTTWNVTCTVPPAGIPGPTVQVISPWLSTLTVHVGVVEVDSVPQLGDPATSVVFVGAASKICRVPLELLPAGLVYCPVNV
jgi:hypothetical protein